MTSSRGVAGRDDFAAAVAHVWAAAAGEPGALAMLVATGKSAAVPSCFRVTDAAAAAAGAASLSVACLSADRNDKPVPAVTIDRMHALVAFRSERYLETETALSLGDPLMGDYPTADGWIRIHTNYRYHRAAVLRVLGTGEDRAQYAAAIARYPCLELEDAVVEAGGAAAAMRDKSAWDVHAHGRTLGSAPLLTVERVSAASLAGDGPLAPAPQPLHGVRVLDLTCVLAGPTATKFLAAHGANVLRVEPPGFEEVPALSVDGNFGKRSTWLDLKTDVGRHAFEHLLRQADVVVHGFRPGALEALGYDAQALEGERPGLITASLSAWGDSGPWAERRGFDSLVQMATGIAHQGMVAFGAHAPRPLPCQLLDHATAYLLALGVVQALRRRATEGGTYRVRAALAHTAAWVQRMGTVDHVAIQEPSEAVVALYRGEMQTPWGMTRYIRPPGAMAGIGAEYTAPPPLPGADRPGW